MATPQHHLFLCTNTRPPGHPKGSCGERGANEILTALKSRIKARNLQGIVQVNGSSCLKPCEWGPNAVLYPEGVWYSGVTAEDIDAILDATLERRVVERLCMPPEAMKAFPERPANS
jgi:(2Fe-2S) ferredoxin